MYIKQFLLVLLISVSIFSSASGQALLMPEGVPDLFSIINKTKAKTSLQNKSGNANLRQSTTEYLWTDNQWNRFYLYYFEYDEHDNRHKTIWETYWPEPDILHWYIRFFATFDQKGNEITTVKEMFAKDEWVPYIKDSMVYDENGNRILRLVVGWINNAWEYNGIYINEYEKHGIETLSLTIDCSGEKCDTLIGDRKLITYSDAGNIKEIVLEYMNREHSWKTLSKYTITYDNNENVTGAFYHDYKEDTKEWFEVIRYTDLKFYKNKFGVAEKYNIISDYPLHGLQYRYRYQAYFNSNDKPDSSITEIYDVDESIWKDYQKHLFEYNIQGEQTELLNYIFSDNMWFLGHGERDVYIYDSAARLVEHTFSMYGLDTGIWIYQNKEVHTYKDIITSFIIDEQSFAHTIYPNPARELLKIELQGLKTERVRITIMDVTGKIIFNDNIGTQSGILNATVNTAGFKPGIYIIQVQSGNQTLEKKIVKE